MTAAARDTRPSDALTVYRRLIHDARLCNGARCLWHYLRDRADKSGKCWPEQRNIAREMRCKTHSLPGWTAQLVSAGYLAARKTGQSHRLEYQILFGDERGGLPEWATRGKTQRPSCRPKGQAASPPEATPRVAQTGDGSKRQGVIQKEVNHESNKPPVVIKDLHPELTALMQDAREILGLDEMRRCHRRWLERAQSQPEKLRRVLADVRATKGERDVKNPGAYAEDLWQRRFAP